MKITKKDIQILSHLRRDSREMLTKLSRKTGIPVSTIFDRLKYHKNGLIKKNTTLMDFSLLGFNSRAKVILKVDKTDRISIKNLLTVHRNINAAYRINNENVCINRETFDSFLSDVEDSYVSRVFYTHDETLCSEIRLVLDISDDDSDSVNSEEVNNEITDPLISDVVITVDSIKSEITQ